MSNILFFQIEIMLITIALLASFVIVTRQNAKDNSWSRRAAALGEVLNKIAKGIKEEEKQ